MKVIKTKNGNRYYLDQLVSITASPGGLGSTLDFAGGEAISTMVPVDYLFNAIRGAGVDAVLEMQLIREAYERSIIPKTDVPPPPPPPPLDTKPEPEKPSPERDAMNEHINDANADSVGQTEAKMANDSDLAGEVEKSDDEKILEEEKKNESNLD